MSREQFFSFLEQFFHILNDFKLKQIYIF